MKLLAKTNLYFVWVSLIVFAIGGVLFFFLFKAITDRDLNNKLYARKNYVSEQIARSDSLLFYQKFSANTLSVKRIGRGDSLHEIVSDTVLFDDIEHKKIGYRQLTFGASINNENYRISIRRALIETKDLIKGVVALEGILFLGFVAILTVLNSQLSRQLWKPFYAILDTINNYKLDHAETLTFEKSTTTEFNELAGAIEKMSSKINREFNSQKEFTENASHEIQTPLAIVKNKLEVLLQTNGLSEEQLTLINSTMIAANRLSKLNEALLILSKIENKQFHTVEKVCINDLVERHLIDLDELVKMKKISVRRLYNEIVNIRVNPFLVEILVENLIVNAIKHNFSPGFLSIIIEHNNLTISNTGEDARIDPERLFDRFAKGNRSSSLGLGLAIVKAICDTYMLPIRYSFDNRIHQVRIELQNLIEKH